MDPALVAQFALEGRVCVITGAASGMGREAARVFAQAGARLVLADVDAEGLAATAALVATWARDVATQVVDVADRAQVQALGALAEGRGGVRVWANVAGVHAAIKLAEIAEADVDRLVSVNLKGPLWGTLEAVRIMTNQEGGSIINISSSSADQPGAGATVYAMTKAAVNALTRNVALEAGPAGVRVNAIAPGYVDTPFVAFRFRNPDGTINEARRDRIFAHAAALTPLNTIGQPSDVALAMLYLASDASRFITGQVLRPNGGIVMPL